MQRLFNPPKREKKPELEQRDSSVGSSSAYLFNGNANKDKLIYKKLRKDVKEFTNEKFGVSGEENTLWDQPYNKAEFLELLGFLGFIDLHKLSAYETSCTNDMWQLDLKSDEDGSSICCNILILLAGVMNLKESKKLATNLSNFDSTAQLDRTTTVDSKGYLQFKADGKAYFATQKDI